MRFGDVVTGFAATSPEFKIPPSDEPLNWRIRIIQPKHFVVLSPCCSIEKGCLLIAPLAKIRPAFLSNPYLAEDLTRINAFVPPEKTIPPNAWENLPSEEKAKRLTAGAGYVFLECFVYAPHEYLGTYQLHRQGGAIQQSSYLIDFGTTFRVECDAISRDRPAPTGTKVIELTVDTRKALRNKIAAYYTRIPEEDLIGVVG